MSLTDHIVVGANLRLWAILVQLRYIHGDQEQLNVLKQALREVPKSGEVWCEVSTMKSLSKWHGQDPFSSVLMLLLLSAIPGCEDSSEPPITFLRLGYCREVPGFCHSVHASVW